MGTAVALRDVVREAENILLVRLVPLQSNFHGNAVPSGGRVQHGFMQRLLGTMQVLDEGADAAHVLEPVMFARTIVEQIDDEATVEKRQFPQAARKDGVVKVDVLEDFRTWAERDGSPGVVRISNCSEGGNRVPVPVLLHPDVAISANTQRQAFGQGIDDRNADSVKSAGDFVGVIVKFAACMQRGHDDLGRRDALFLMNVHRDPAPVVLHADRSVIDDADRYLGAVAGKRLVHAVINDLKHHVVKAGPIVGITDVHAGALTNSVQAFQDFDVG